MPSKSPNLVALVGLRRPSLLRRPRRLRRIRRLCRHPCIRSNRRNGRNRRARRPADHRRRHRSRAVVWRAHRNSRYFWGQGLLFTGCNSYWAISTATVIKIVVLLTVNRIVSKIIQVG